MGDSARLAVARHALVHHEPDPDFRLDYLRRAHVDAASCNSGGIIAFYPTRIPDHKRNANLGGSDPFGYLVEGCRRMGLIVTARVDHHATYPDAVREPIPRGSRSTPKASRAPHWATPEFFLTCTPGPYNESFVT